MQVRHGWLVAVLASCWRLWPAASPADAPVAHAAATCADYPNQAAAQRAADTRDPDGDGIYCESLPCPCSTASGGGDAGGGRTTAATRRAARSPPAVQRLVFSAIEVPATSARTSARPFARAGRGGWCVNRPRRRRAPRPAAGGHPDARRLRPRRVPAGGRAGQGHRPGARPRPARLEGRRALRRQLREPLARRLARRQAAATSATAPVSATCSGSGCAAIRAAGAGRAAPTTSWRSPALPHECRGTRDSDTPGARSAPMPPRSPKATLRGTPDGCPDGRIAAFTNGRRLPSRFTAAESPRQLSPSARIRGEKP